MRNRLVLIFVFFLFTPLFCLHASFSYLASILCNNAPQDFLILEHSESWLYSGRYPLEEADEKAHSSELLRSTEKTKLRFISRKGGCQQVIIEILPNPRESCMIENNNVLFYDSTLEKARRTSCAIPPVVLLEETGCWKQNIDYAFSEEHSENQEIFCFDNGILNIKYYVNDSKIIQKDIKTNNILTSREFFKDHIILQDRQAIPLTIIKWELSDYDKVTVTRVLDHQIGDFSNYLSHDYIEQIFSKFNDTVSPKGGI